MSGTVCSKTLLIRPSTSGESHRYKKRFHVFNFGHVFFTFLTLFIFQTFFILKNVGKVQSGKQINKIKHFQNKATK